MPFDDECFGAKEPREELFGGLRQSVNGATLIEYVLMAALISVVMIVALGAVAVPSVETFQNAGESMDGEIAGGY